MDFLVSVIIPLYNAEKYIEKASVSQAKMMQANFKLYGTPLCITPQTLKIDFDELYDLIFEELYLNRSS